MDRPVQNDKAILTNASERFVDAFYKNELDDREGTIRSLVRNYSFNNDGYHFAKSLDNDGWNCTVQDVENLECFEDYVREEYKKAVSKWLIHEGIKPKYSLGDKVLFVRRFKDTVVGIIDEVHYANDKHHPGYYSIKPKDPSEEEVKNQTIYIKKWEEVQNV